MEQSLEMTGAATESSAPEPTVSATRAWFLHLWSFALPLLTLGFLWSGPYSWWQGLLWMLPIWILVMIDNRSPPDRRQPAEDIPNWPFDLQMYLLFALQIFNHVLLGVMASKLAFSSWTAAATTVANFFAMQSVSGVCAGYSGIVLAHELVHRRKAHQYFMGRVLLMFVCYEHFATEHIRGHHPRVGTRADPATARFGETHRNFLRRTIPAQYKSAWRLELQRVGEPGMRWYDPRWLKHRVLQGFVAQVGLIAGYGLLWGPIAAVFFIGQSRLAVWLLESVNYIEHWGLTRQGKTVESIDSWDTENWFTLHTLVGLSRHADHHHRASRPYHRLRHFDDSPKMPRGYYGTLVLAAMRNDTYQELAKAELQRRKLGPYRDATTPA
jgi:alkane 1-monooxygenase